jgi:hypothetical protein
MRNPRYDCDPLFLPDSGNTGPVRLNVRFDPEA